MVAPSAQFSQVNGQSVPMHVLNIGRFRLFMKNTTVLDNVDLLCCMTQFQSQSVYCCSYRAL